MRAVIRELIETVILALVIFLVLQFSVQNFRVEGSSMEPTLEEGQYLLVNKLVYFHFDPRGLAAFLPFLSEDGELAVFPFHAPSRGEVIIFRFPRNPSRDFVKRVIGMPGDVVEIHRGQLFINGEAVEEPYITYRDLDNMEPVRVPPDSYFVLGDNRRASNDSRDWGAVPADHIIGRAWVSYWPLGRWHTLGILPWR